MPRSLRCLFALVLSCSILSAVIAWQNTNSKTEVPLEKLPVLQTGPTWWRGNLHTHSLWSDGDDFPEMSVDGYKKAGYDFVALSDHNTLAEGERYIEADPAVLADYRARFGEDWVEVAGDGRVRLKTFEEYRKLFEEECKFLLIQSEEITDVFEQKPLHLN